MIDAAILAAIGDAVAGSTFTVLGDDAPVAELVARIRAAPAELVLLLVTAETSPVDRAMLHAAIGPLAVERAPARVCALDIASSASETDVVAAASFLARAASTTGQLLSVR